jgi:membrane protein YqaA with SNARE-associated domain
MRWAALVAVIAITALAYTQRDRAEELAIYGYPGIFLVSILANATVILPIPGLLIPFSLGAVFNPIWVAIAAGAGAALGELTGYLAGFSGQAVVENVELYDRLTQWMQKNGYLTILVLAIIPNPFFDLAGIAAGAFKMPITHFLFWCLLGKTIKMLLVAYAGASAIPWLLHY